MNGVVRAFASGAAGVFIADAVSPYLAKVVKPDSDFTAKAMKAASAGVGTAAAYYVLGMFGGAK